MKRVLRMFPRMAVLAGAVLLSFGTGQARAEWANFVGGGVIHDFDASCTWDARPYTFNARVNIPDLTDPDAPMTISFVANHYAMSYRLEQGRLDNSFQTVRAMTLYSTFQTHRARIRLLGALPDLSSQDPIRLRGMIRNFDGLGCNAQFDVTVSRGPAV